MAHPSTVHRHKWLMALTDSSIVCFLARTLSCQIQTPIWSMKYHLSQRSKTLSSVDRHNVQHKYIHRQCSPRCHCHCFAQMLLTSLLISYQHAVQASATPAAALSFTQARASKRCLNTRAATVRRNTWQGHRGVRRATIQYSH